MPASQPASQLASQLASSFVLRPVVIAVVRLGPRLASSSAVHTFIHSLDCGAFSQTAQKSIMSDVDLDEFLDTIDDDDLIGGGGGGDGGDVGMSGVAAGAFSSAAAVRSSSRGSSSGGRKSSPSSKKGKAGSVVKFPAKLHDMLTQSQLSNGIMEWRQEGTCFKILDRDRLAAELLPIYFVSNIFDTSC